MTKAQQREVKRLQRAYDLGMDDMVTRALSALIRASLTTRSRAALMKQAREWDLVDHPEFIV